MSVPNRNNNNTLPSLREMFPDLVSRPDNRSSDSNRPRSLHEHSPRYQPATIPYSQQPAPQPDCPPPRSSPPRYAEDPRGAVYDPRGYYPDTRTNPHTGTPVHHQPPPHPSHASPYLPPVSAITSARSSLDMDPVDSAYARQRYTTAADSSSSSYGRPPSPGGYYSQAHGVQNPADLERPGKRRRGNLPKHVTDLLRGWLNDHLHHPYPSEDEKQMLMAQTGLTIHQISNWFINARRRRVPAMQQGGAGGIRRSSSGQL